MAETRKCLGGDLEHLKKFFGRITPHPEGRWVEVTPNLNNPQLLGIHNFPLAKGFVDDRGQYVEYPRDYEPFMLMVIAGYPKDSPNGIHLPNQSANLRAIKTALHGHLRDEPIGDKNNLKRLKDLGFLWVCFHYKNHYDWKFNPVNIPAGDSLTKYLTALHAVLSGARVHARY